MLMNRESVIVELASEPSVRPEASRRDRIAELRRAANVARHRFEGFLDSMREFDPELTVDANDTMFPIIIITARAEAIRHLRDNHPALVRAVKQADGLSIPEVVD